jgi:hypothetical protein
MSETTKITSQLDVLRKFFVEQEEALTQALACRSGRPPSARHREGRVEAEDLRRMLEGYREQHRARAMLSATEALRFQRFHQRLTDAVRAQEEFVNRLTLTMKRSQRERRSSHRRDASDHEAP